MKAFTLKIQLDANSFGSPSSPPFFMPDAFPTATFPIYPGLGQALSYAGLHIPWLAYTSLTQSNSKDGHS